MFRSLLYHHSYRHGAAALAGTTAGMFLLASAAATTTTASAVDCEGAPKPPPPPSSSPPPPPEDDASSPNSRRMPSRSGTRFFTQYFAHKDDTDNRKGGKHSEASAGLGGGRQEVPAEGAPRPNTFTSVRPRARPPCPEWDYNWDGRQTEATSPETMATKKGFYASRELGNVRHILLVRHGQYREDFKDDKRRVLTPLGRHQAELTGQRLALMQRGGLGMINPEFSGPLNFKAIHVSDMARAKETAKIISSHLPGVPVTDPDPMLNEALPAGMVPSRPDIDAEAARREIEANQDRIEAAFQKYVHRADPYDDHEMVEHDTAHDDEFQPHEFEVIVGHGNVIRYFFCRALQLPPEVWLRFSTFNCSITYIMVQPNGLVSIRGMGDFGHMPYDSLTFSGLHGLNW